MILQSRAPYSAEARDARASEDHAAGLRRLIKRRDAIASVSPYAAAMVAITQEWIYENGVLCHVLDGELRILDLHRSADEEMVVVLRKLAREAIPETRAPHRYKLKLLYYSHGILSLAYSFRSADKPGFKHYLVVFNPLTGQIIRPTRLDSISKLFVRNDDRYLFYGITSDPDEQGNEMWHIRSLSLTTGAWVADHLDLDVIGTDIGSTVCFEIFDGHFYVLSNLRSLDVEEVDWVSYYYCLRFPLAQDGFDRLEELDPRPDIWRRDQTEGPIDDRWTFLRLLKDEATGQLKAVESRKEWLNSQITGRRTCYTTIISFDDAPEEDSGSDISATKTQQGAGPRRWPRSPDMVHPEDGNSAQHITLTKCPVRSYYPACQTAIDLVDDSSSFNPRDQQLRFRGSTRRPWTPGELAQLRRSAAIPGGEQDHEALLRQIDNLYRSDAGLFWPPKKDPAADEPALAELHAILNPPEFIGNPHGSWDERSTVYATGRVGEGHKALVFVSWDPSIHLTGTAPYPGDLGSDRPGSWAHSPMPRPAAKASKEEKGKGVVDTSNRDTQSSGASQPKLLPWREFRPAMYRSISKGFHFCR